MGPRIKQPFHSANCARTNVFFVAELVEEEGGGRDEDRLRPADEFHLVSDIARWPSGIHRRSESRRRTGLRTFFPFRLLASTGGESSRRSWKWLSNSKFLPPIYRASGKTGELFELFARRVSGGENYGFVYQNWENCCEIKLKIYIFTLKFLKRIFSNFKNIPLNKYHNEQYRRLIGECFQLCDSRWLPLEI